MTTFEHPQLEDLLLWQTGEMSPAEAESIEAHLKQCSACQNTIANAESLFGRIAKVDAEAERRRKQADSKHRSRLFMGTTASVVIGALLLVSSTQWTPEARAESLITKAVQEQKKEERPIHFLKVQSGSLACNITLGDDTARLKFAFAGSPHFCESVSAHLASAGRQWSDLLSAESFQQWRHSLRKKQESIHKTEDRIEISTATDQGVMREASLQLRFTDYHPIAAHFEFSGDDPMKIDVNEDRAAEEVTARALTAMPTDQQNIADSPRASMVDPLDEVEAHVRLALHDAQLDKNILLAVERRRDAIFVWGVVPAEAERSAATTAVQSIPHVQLALLTEAEQQEARKPLPWASFQGDAPPLANDQLNLLFAADGSGREQLQNDLDALTRRLVGEAKTRDALLALRSRLTSSRYDQPLQHAVAELTDAMRTDSLSLTARLAPLTGPMVHGGLPLTYGQAMQLYTLVHEMTFMDQSRSNLQLAQAVNQTRRLLARR